MRGRRWAAVALGLVLAGAGAADLDRVLVSVKAGDQPLRTVIRALAQQTGLDLQVDGRVPDGLVTLNLTDQPLSRALDLLSRSVGMVWEPLANGAVITLPATARAEVVDLGQLPARALLCRADLLARPVTVAFEQVDVPTVFQTLSRLTEVRLRLQPALGAGMKVTANFHETPLSRCLVMLGLTVGCFVRSPDGQSLLIEGPERVAVERSDEPRVRVKEHYPADYRGILGYLLAEEFVRQPGRFGCAIVRDADGQPRVQPAAAP